MSSAVDCGDYLHPGTSDWLVSESDDHDMLRKQLPWVNDMNNMMEDVAVLATRRWQDAVSLSSDDAVADKTSLEHFDK